MKQIFAIIGFILATTCNAGTITYSCNKVDAKAINRAITVYLDTHEGLKAKEVNITSKECVKNFALVVLHPKKPVTDDARVYLQKINQKWKVLNLATDFSHEFLAKIPEELR